MNDIDGKLLIINEKINTIKDEILEIEMSMENRFVTLRNMVNEEREKEREINIINNKISHNEQAKSKVIEMEEEFNRYLSEANSIIGQSILSYKEIDAKSIIDNYNIYDNKKNIDKYK
ncbi:MAG: hypothetical protein QM532_00870 [Cyanobium sp. MAG06]|nr:hypothetical protein [Cyanobium sp. MAG06]